MTPKLQWRVGALKSGRFHTLAETSIADRGMHDLPPDRILRWSDPEQRHALHLNSVTFRVTC